MAELFVVSCNLTCFCDEELSWSAIVAAVDILVVQFYDIPVEIYPNPRRTCVAKAMSIQASMGLREITSYNEVVF